MGGTTNINKEDMPCEMIIPVLPANMKTKEKTIPIKLLINRMARNANALIPADCFKFSVNNLSLITD